MKKLLIILLQLFFISANAADYQDYLNSILKDMKNVGIGGNVFAQNPFQTGTALTNYYLAEKSLLLERDTFFQLKANKLESTDDVADYHHRLKVLRTHANNMHLLLLNSLSQRNKEGFIQIEKPKHQKTLEEIIEACKKDAACIADKIKNPETAHSNILLDNFALASQIFKDIPYMHAVEFNSIYQLVQLIYLEALVGHIKVSNVEFDLFIKKQKELKTQINKNHQLTKTEKKLHSAIVNNTVKKWKLRIAKRKFDNKDDYKRQYEKLLFKNKEIHQKIIKLRENNPRVVLKAENCFKAIFKKGLKDRQRCNLRKSLMKRIKNYRDKNLKFANQEEQDLPDDFFESI